MKELEQRILSEGKVIRNGEIIKVDSFIDHQVDLQLMEKIAQDMLNHLESSGILKKINKIVTIETSGIPLATMVAHKLSLPMVFARKKIPVTLIEPLYSRKIVSPTKLDEVEIVISSKYLSEKDSVYIVDDFLATGVTSLAIMDLIRDAGCKVVGIGAIIENAFLGGRDIIKEKYPEADIYACVRIKKMTTEGHIEFHE